MYLALLVAVVEQQLRSGVNGLDPVDDRLNHPNFAATLKALFTASARTESKSTHRVLSELVAGRLAAVPDSLDAILHAVAVETILRISAQQTNAPRLRNASPASAASCRR